MEKQQLLNLLNQVSQGEVSPDEALKEIQLQPFEDLGFAKIDTHRGIRQGMNEVIYGEGKTKEQILTIVNRMVENSQQTILITRLDEDKANYIKNHHTIIYDKLSRICIVGKIPKPTGKGKILVVCAGTSDLYCANEAVYTAKAMGNEVETLFDVGVAGVHRLLSNTDKILSARVIIAVAGMEGALASVVGGLAQCPVIAVPTSVGYGANFGGLSALLAMMNSCASTVSVVNIDNGFSAGCVASIINHLD